MQYPQIHLNGSDATRLCEQYMAAVYALNDAIAAVRSIDVNGRDYYTISKEATTIALNEHQARIKALETIWSDLTAIAETIETQA